MRKHFCGHLDSSLISMAQTHNQSHVEVPRHSSERHQNIMSFNIMKRSINGSFLPLSINDTQQNNTAIIMSVTFYLLFVLHVIMLSVVMLNVDMLSVMVPMKNLRLKFRSSFVTKESKGIFTKLFTR